MALSIDTCNDIEKYEEAVFAGLNAKKTVSAGIALIFGGFVGFMLITLAHWPPILAVYGATPVTCIGIVMGFYEKDGMTLFQMIRNKMRRNQNKPICYRSTENKEEYEKHEKDTSVKTKEEADAEFERIKKLVIYGVIGSVSALILIIILLLILV